LEHYPEKIIDVSFSGFSRNAAIPSGDRADLNAYCVGTLVGGKILEKNIAGSRSLRKVDDIENLFKMLAADRVDVAVINEVDGRVYEESNGLSGIEVLSPPFARREMFLYLPNRHEAIVPELAGVLAAMKADGIYRRIVESVLSATQNKTQSWTRNRSAGRSPDPGKRLPFRRAGAAGRVPGIPACGLGARPAVSIPSGGRHYPHYPVRDDIR
jgi:hypothetical protein